MTNDADRFIRLNSFITRKPMSTLPARENPFATDRVLTIRYRLSRDGWSEMLGKLARLDHRAAIVGPEGSGKTTLLEDLAAPLERQGFRVRWLRLSRESPRFDRAFWASVEPRDVILFDGAEQLGRWGWRRFRFRARRAAGLVVTSHRPGMLPTLIACRATPELLRDIVSGLYPTRSAEFNSLLDALYAKHDGNIRLVLRELYDLAAERKLPSSA
jgi:hypothetical protein